MAEPATVAGSALGQRAVELLSELIRADTVNPPGNEDRVQEPLAQRLRDSGFEVTLLAAEPGRPNLIADLPGESPGHAGDATRPGSGPGQASSPSIPP